MAWPKGKKHSDESNKKRSATLKGIKKGSAFSIKMSDASKRRWKSEAYRIKFKEARKGEKDKRWKGDSVGKRRLHTWLSTHFGKSKECENLKCSGECSAFDWANISGKYKRDRKDFVQLCRSCHLRFDRWRNKFPLGIDGIIFSINRVHE